jgi:putative Mg2+ transporter-C (MgtC) family protein
MWDSIAAFFTDIYDYAQSFSDVYWYTFIKYLVKLSAAFIITLPLALEREYFSRSLGLRTFPLVAVASCGYVLVSESFIGDNPDAKARVMQGLMTGIGFIGGGAILKQEDKIMGAATAVSLWSTGTVGAAVAHNRFEIAILIALANFIALRVLSPIKDEMTDAGMHSPDGEPPGDDPDEV